MATDIPGNRFEIEFDEHGRLRILDPELARRVMLRAVRGEGIELLIDTDPLPLLTTRCTLPPPPPNGSRCPNEMCPYTGVNLRITPESQPGWESLPGPG